MQHTEKGYKAYSITARCTLVQSTVLRLHVVRPSVRLSVCDVGGSGPHRKLIARTISPTPSLFVAQRPYPPILPGEHGEIWGRLEVGCGKVACLSTKAAISLKRVKTEENLPWIATLFRMVPSRPPTVSSSARLGVCIPHPKLQSLLSQDFKFGWNIRRVHPNQSLLKFWTKGSVSVSMDCPNLSDTPITSGGPGKATNFKLCRPIHRINRKKSPLKFREM